MCGIFALLNDSGFSNETINSQFIKGKNRGPEYSKLKSFYNFNLNLGFHRLAINGLNEKSNQPLSYQNIFLICNGEIYNYKHLYKIMDINPETDSDCEVVIYLYLRYGIEQTLQMLDGVFAFILYDHNNSNIYVARDPLGVRPLYQLSNLTNSSLIGFASELKCLNEFVNIDNSKGNKSYNRHPDDRIVQFTPGTYSVFRYNKCIWDEYPTKQNISYFIRFRLQIINLIGRFILKILLLT